MMRLLASGDLYACDSAALVRLAWSLNCAPPRKPGETNGAYRGRLVHAIQRAEKAMARSHVEAERVKGLNGGQRRRCGK